MSDDLEVDELVIGSRKSTHEVQDLVLTDGWRAGRTNLRQVIGSTRYKGQDNVARVATLLLDGG